MEPASIAAGAVALLGPYLRGAAEQFAGAAGTAIWSMTRSLLGKLKDRLAGTEAADAMGRFEQDPDETALEMEAVLAIRFRHDPGLLAQVAAVLAQAKKAGPQVTVVQKVQEAEQLVGVRARRVTRGSVQVEQDLGTARGAVGAEFDGLE